MYKKFESKYKMHGCRQILHDNDQEPVFYSLSIEFKLNLMNLIIKVSL